MADTTTSMDLINDAIDHFRARQQDGDTDAEMGNVLVDAYEDLAMKYRKLLGDD